MNLPNKRTKKIQVIAFFVFLPYLQQFNLRLLWILLSFAFKTNPGNNTLGLKNSFDRSSRIDCCCSVTKSCPTLCALMDCTVLGFPVLHYLQEFVQTHVHWISDAIQLSHPLSPPSLLATNLSQDQGLFQ